MVGGKIVRTVPDQNFFVMAYDQDGTLSQKNEILYTALMLKAGDSIRGSNGKPNVVTAVSKVFKEEVPTWDLVLEKGVFYYADGLKVHSVME